MNYDMNINSLYKHLPNIKFDPGDQIEGFFQFNLKTRRDQTFLWIFMNGWLFRKLFDIFMMDIRILNYNII